MSTCFEIPKDPKYRSTEPARRGLAHWTALLLVPLVVSACSTFSTSDAPPQKEQTRLDISIEAATDSNLDPKGRGAPMLVRIYELKADVAFQDADFFALQNADKAALGPDLLAVDQFILRPGETRHIMRKSRPDTTAIGVFAGYRDLPNAVWRVVYKMQPAPDASWVRSVVPANKAVLKVQLQASAIELTDLEPANKLPAYANENFKAGSQAVESSKEKAADIASKLDALK